MGPPPLAARLAVVRLEAGPKALAFGGVDDRLYGMAAVEDEDLLAATLTRYGVGVTPASGAPEAVLRRVSAALAYPGEGVLAGWELGFLPPFDRAVHRVVVGIPHGQVRPYAWVARRAGRPRAQRAAGSALRRSPFGDLLPWHRVGLALGRDGGAVAGRAVRQTAEGLDLAGLARRLGRSGRLLANRTTGRCCLPTCVLATDADLAVTGPLQARRLGLWPCEACDPYDPLDL